MGYFSLIFHDQIWSLSQAQPLLQFVRSYPNLSDLLLVTPPESIRAPAETRREQPREETQINYNLYSRLIDPFLEHYITRAQSLIFSKSVFNKTFKILKKALVSTTDEGVIVCPITNLVINRMKIEVDKNVSIRRLTEKEIESWISESGWDHPPMTFSELTSLQSAIEITFDKRRDYSGIFGSYAFTSSDFNPERDVIRKVLTPLQITFSRKLNPAFLQIEITNGFFGRSLYYEWKEIYDFDCKLEKKEMRIFRKILRSINQRKIESNLELAMKKWDDAQSRDDLEDKLLDLWAALETLFIRDKNPEKQYRLVSRICAFLGTNKGERGEMFDVLKDSYNYRSCIVHGSPKELTKIRGDRMYQGKMIGRTNTCLRKALLMFLESGNVDIDALKIEKRLVERGDWASVNCSSYPRICRSLKWRHLFNSLVYMTNTMLKEDFQKLLQQTPEQLAAQLSDGDPGSSKTFCVKALLEYKLQRAVIAEARKMAWITIAVACIPALSNIVTIFMRVQ